MNPATFAGRKGQEMASVNARLRWWGVPEDVCKDALNPGKLSCTVTCFHVVSDVV